jgi:uncharacterized protein YjeT (DUF2065 family)
MNINLLFLIFGAVLVLEGLPYFLFPEKLKEFYQQIEKADPGVLRTIGFMLLMLGLLIVYLTKGKV